MSDLTARFPSISPPTPDELIARIAARQHGVITLAQLLRCGLDRNGIARRVKAGRLHRLSRGVFAVGHTGLAPKGHMLAAVLACGPGAALGHLHAASLSNVSRFPLPSLIDVVAPRERAPSLPVRVHRSRTLHPNDVTTLHRIPVTRLPRTLVDLAEDHTPHQLANLIHQGAYRGHFDLATTRDAMARANGRRLRRLTRAIELHLSGSAGTRSTAEDTFLRRIDGRLPEPLVNTHLLDEEVDFHWPERRLVVEVDGPGHGRPATKRDDERKNGKLEAAGYTVLRFSDVEVQSGGCYALICRTYASL